MSTNFLVHLTATLISRVFPYLTLFYILFQVYTLIHWRKKWRILAIIPLLITVPLLAHSIYALSQGSNIWPILLIFSFPFAGLYLGIVALVRHFSLNKGA